METTIYIEIPVSVKFDFCPGQVGSWNDPSFPPSIEDIDFDNEQVLKAVRDAVHGSTIDEELMEVAIEKIKEKIEYAADLKYEEMKTRTREDI